MEKKNLFVTTEDGRILFLGENVLPYIDMERDVPLGYPAGRLRKNDLVILCVRQCDRLKKEVRSAIQKIGNCKLPAAGIFFMVAEFSGVMSPIYLSKPLSTTELQWETMYKHCQVKLEIDQKEIQIEINKHRFAVPEDGDGCQCIIYNRRGINYYHAHRSGKKKELLEDVLNGADFDGFLENEILDHSGYRVESVFRKDFFTLINGMEKEAGIFNYRQKPLSVSRHFLKNDGKNIIAYEVFSRKNLVEYIEDASRIYENLYETSVLESQIQPYSLNFSLSGNDERIQSVKYLLEKSCRTNATILLTGESGTGKTFIAENIHLSSKRRDKPFVHVNCAAISPSLIESELFGYEQGAFTGALQGGRKGYFEIADKGTLFLDEIAEIPYALQGKLLEAIQNKSFYRVGGTQKVQVDFRLIVATNRDLNNAVREKEFRQDLYYRINVFPICLVPLRERLEALHYIIADLLPQICTNVGVPLMTVSPQGLNKMKNYHWPGNIRELENVLEKAVILSNGEIILPGDIILPEGDKLFGHSLNERKERFEKELICEALEKCEGERQRTAEYLQISRTSLFEKMKKYGIE